MILKHLWSFSRKPEYLPYSRIPFVLRLKILLSLAVWNLLFSMAIVLFSEGLMQWFEIEVGSHKIEEFISKYSLQELFFLMVIMAPILEEVLFRGPLFFFRRSSYFPVVFYLSCIAFGLVHLGNFENASTLLPWAPFLVAPQILMGFFLGFLRVKLGLGYAILMHMGHNGLLFMLLSLTDFQ